MDCSLIPGAIGDHESALRQHPFSRGMCRSIQAQAEDVYGEPGKAAQWLNRSNRLRENRTPLEAIKTDRGFQMVPTILGRMEYVRLQLNSRGYRPCADGPSVIALFSSVAPVSLPQSPRTSSQSQRPQDRRSRPSDHHSTFTSDRGEPT